MFLGPIFKFIKEEYPELDTFERVETAHAALTLSHNGQYSEEYAALCKLGNIYRPAMGGYEERTNERANEVSDFILGKTS